MVSVRVRSELKRQAEELGIDLREVVERALEEAVREARRKQLAEALREMGDSMEGLAGEEWMRLVRMGRRRGEAVAGPAA